MIDSSDFSVRLLPGFSMLMQAHQRAGQQHDNLCGPYWVAVLLQSYGFDTSPEAIALLAGSVLPICDPQLSVPPGGTPRLDYDRSLPLTEDLKASGTSAPGLIDAVSQITQDQYCLLPLTTDWSASQIEALLQLCRDCSHWQAMLLCNIQTGHLWSASLTVADATAYLSGAEIAEPPADWDVGHFVLIAGTVTGAARSLVLICDTYLQFGWQGYHLQPASAVAQSLNRNDGYSGGILLFLPSQYRNEATDKAAALGLQVEIWDNGSPVAL